MNNGSAQKAINSGKVTRIRPFSPLMSQRQALQHIVSSTQRFLSNFPLSCSLSDSRPLTLPPCPPLSLSESLSKFRVKVKECGLLPQISQIVLSRATELAHFYERSYQQACQRLMAVPFPHGAASQNASPALIMRRLVDTYRHLFENNVLPRFLSDTLKAQSTNYGRQTSHSKRSGSSRHPFNHVSQASVVMLSSF